jgi:hypothetical protein
MFSGDARQNSGKAATAASRDAAVERGATVNGLPIVAEDDPHADDCLRRAGPRRVGHFLGDAEIWTVPRSA